MKQLVARTLMLLTLAVMGLTMTSQAQITSVIKVNIPFEFNFAGRTFPAGEYSLMRPMQHLLVLRDSRGHSIAQTFTGGVESLTPADATRLKFSNSDGQYVLTEVWQNLDSSGQRLYSTKSSTTIAKHRSTEAREASEGSQP
jgi:hypothetical protein